jgi:cob(I)alamin adenosyltransferase
MTRFYTQTGDDGYTGILGEGRTPKYDHRIETLGALDEANAAIGLARSMSEAPQTITILLEAQRDLYHIMTEIASLPENAARLRKISAERVNWLETQIELISNKVIIPSEFIVPGDSQAGAMIDLARTIIRRAERHIAYLLHHNDIENQELLRYVNRLSSLCFVLELFENQVAGKNETTFAKE